MKKLANIIAILMLSAVMLKTTAQKIKTQSGNPDILKSENSVNIEFVYDNISVGKYKSESEYIKAFFLLPVA